MDRVAERPVSPLSTTNRSSTNSSSSCNSRDFGKPRRSYYRLFPSVEPTPPASPISLQHQQRASLRNSFIGGSSLRRRSSSEDNGRGARDSHQLPPHALAKSFVSPIKDVRKGSVPELSPLWTVQENGSSGIAVEVRSGMKPVEGDEGSKQARASSVFNNVFDSALTCTPSTKACDTSAETFAQRGYDRQIRPQDIAMGPAIGLGLDIPTVLTPDDDQTLSQGHVSARTKPRPNLRIAIVRQNSEAKPASPPKSSQHSREVSVESLSDGSMHSPFSIQDQSTRRGVRVASVALKQSIVPLKGEMKVRELTVAPHAGRLRASQPVQHNETDDRLHRPTSPPVPSRNSVGRWAELPSLASRFNSRAADPEPYVRLSPDPQAVYAIRPAQGPLTSRAASISTGEYAESSRDPTPELSAKSALAAARANVAALGQVEVTAWNSSFSEHNKDPASDLGLLRSRPPNAGIADPVQTLAELAEQVEALHARYATLRAQRQQLSSSIVADVKNQKSGDTLLNEQLSLAAVSSSIDICFAKLKSLECVREDAIATLIAQATAVRRSSDEAATASRKSALAPSFDSGSRIATDRSTPDLHALYRLNRPGPIQVHSYRSELDGQHMRSPLHSQRSPPVHESSKDLDYARHPKRLTQTREPEADSETSDEATVASSTADETDGNQTSDLSDIEDMLPEELVRKPHGTDVNGNGLKAVKVLGIRPGEAPPSPMSFHSDATRKNSRETPKLELNLDGDIKSGLEEVSPLTASTLNVDDTDPLTRDLELQLQSFPSAPARTSTAPLTERYRRHEPPMHRSDTRKSKASAYTINVYFDGSHEDAPPLP